jgi:hypothetical protein
MYQWHQDTSGFGKAWIDWWRYKMQEIRNKKLIRE